MHSEKSQQEGTLENLNNNNSLLMRKLIPKENRKFLKTQEPLTDCGATTHVFDTSCSVQSMKHTVQLSFNYSWISEDITSNTSISTIKTKISRRPFLWQFFYQSSRVWLFIYTQFSIPADKMGARNIDILNTSLLLLSCFSRVQLCATP